MWLPSLRSPIMGALLAVSRYFHRVTAHGLSPTVILRISQSCWHNSTGLSHQFQGLRWLPFLTHDTILFHTDQRHNASCNLAQHDVRPTLPSQGAPHHRSPHSTSELLQRRDACEGSVNCRYHVRPLLTAEGTRSTGAHEQTQDTAAAQTHKQLCWQTLVLFL